MRRWFAWGLVLAALWALPRTTARAETYEWERTARLLAASGLEPAELPEGKRIAWIRIVRDEVFVADEVWPSWFNWFHMVTREDVVRRELLFEEGEPFAEVRSEESMRNLRNMAIFALVRIVPVATAEPDAVGVIVHTRDLWSLRLESGFNITTQVDELALSISERNFLGRNKVLTAAFKLIPYSYSLSQLYAARRVWGSSVRLSESAGIVFNRERRTAEGSLWLLKVDRPYYNLKQRYAWAASLQIDNVVARRLVGQRLRTYPENPGDGPFARRAFRQRTIVAAAVGSARFGERVKQAFSLGWDVRTVTADPVAESRLPPELEAGFRAEVMPRERRELGPTIAYELFTPQFHTFENLGTFGQSENVRVGPLLTLALRAPQRAFGSDTSSLVLSGSAGLVLAPGGFLVEGRVGGRSRREGDGWVDQRLDVVLRGATPVLFRSFRFVARAVLEGRREDTVLTSVTLGANNGLRGYTSQQLRGDGASRFLANFELRTLPLEWQAVHVGGVVFYDMGAVYERRDQFELHHAVGLGLRVLFPQFNKRPFSFDGGVSWDPDFRFVPTIASEQVVPLTAAEDPE